MPKIFFLYPNSSQRKQVFQLGHSSTGKYYTLFCHEKASDMGLEPVDDLDICAGIEASRIGWKVTSVLNRLMACTGGVGGEWYKIWSLRHRFKHCDVIFSTTDQVGLPLLLLMRLHLIASRPIVYASIGLPERWRRLKGIWLALYHSAFRRYVCTLIAYGMQEKRDLDDIFGREACHFVAFGVDTVFFDAQRSAAKPTAEQPRLILCIGADRYRDFNMLLRIAPKLNAKILIVTLKERLDATQPLPANVEVRYNIPFLQLPDLFVQATLVALPVQENAYSGATTSLLQAMSMGKSIVVSHTGALKAGYPLHDRVNAWLVSAGDEQAFQTALTTLLESPELREKMGRAARLTAETELSWGRFCGIILTFLKQAVPV